MGIPELSVTARANWLIQSGSGIDHFPRRKDLTFLAIKSALGALPRCFGMISPVLTVKILV